MSQNQHRDAELEPPNTEDDSAPLVQSQGVNAGTDDAPDAPAPAKATDDAQGDPGGAPDLAEQIDGPPDQPAGSRSRSDSAAASDQNQSVEQAQQYGSGGQDAGSMD
jgi:hypothetical protein